MSSRRSADFENLFAVSCGCTNVGRGPEKLKSHFRVPPRLGGAGLSRGVDGHCARLSYTTGTTSKGIEHRGHHSKKVTDSPLTTRPPAT